jgi:hypothetical protein
MRAIHFPHWNLMEWERAGARAISALWAAFWLWFGIASGMGESGQPGDVLLHAAAPGLFFALLAAFAWWKEHAGGILLLVSGLLTYLAYWNMAANRGFAFWFTIGSMLALPQIVAGLLFLAASHRNR